LYLLEAWAAGVPVVQPRHAAFPELIESTGGGLLCEPGDPDSLAEAVERLLVDPAQAREMGAAGRKAVSERFSIEHMARALLACYEPLTRKSVALSP
jgi:glycosyltransferase involved in cell wall biosynthesis